jgi:iron complex outermembrane receptor protein
MKSSAWFLLTILTLAGALQAAAAEDEALAFFREEAKFITASRRALSARKAPATVYVLTAKEMRAAGAVTVWDALRLVPGVDVVETRAGQGDVSIRGFNQSTSNRLLVLLDGKTVLQEFYGLVAWEEIPFSSREIDRIEIVKGPASALYGANAIHGVINIITKTPEQLNGGVAGFTAGNKDTRLGSAVYGRRAGKFSYKVSADYRSMNSFEDADLLASRVAKGHAFFSYDPDPDTSFSVAGGLSRLNNKMAFYSNGLWRPYSDGGTLRADFRGGGTKARAFWNGNSVTLRDFPSGSDPELKYDTYDLNLEQEIALPGNNTLVAGGGYRSNSIRADLFNPGLYKQDLCSLFAENTWEPSGEWNLVASGRLDHHSLSGYVFSPRGAVMYFPDEYNTLKVSAGTAFRNPTLVENYIALNLSGPFSDPALPGFTSVNSSYRGSRSLDPEKMQSVEAAYEGRFERLKTGLAVYSYTLAHLINTADPSFVLSGFPVLGYSSNWANTGFARAFGGEASAEFRLGGTGRVFANYSYFNASESGRHNDSHSSPRHKVNGGFGGDAGALNGMLWAHWAGPTWWDANSTGSAPDLRKVGSYLLLNASAGWKFRGALDGLEARLKAFNFLDNRHYEILPPVSASNPGQYGEKIGARYVVDLAYKF